jgi:ABC-type multidrug transport system permease subunit
MFPLTFVSSAFVPTAAVPGWLRTVIRVNPVSQATSTVRGLTSGGPVTAHLLITVGWMAVLLAVLVPCSIRALRRLD